MHPRLVPGAPGYIFATDAQGNRTTMRMPGLPSPKGVDTKFVGGTMVQTDSADGHVVNVTPGMVQDISRQTSVQGTNSDGTPGTPSFPGRKASRLCAGLNPADTDGGLQVRTSRVPVRLRSKRPMQSNRSSARLKPEIMPRGFPTGAGGDDRAALSTWLKTYAPTSVYQSFVNSGYVPDAPQAQEAAKVMLSQAALDEKAMGGSGGLGLTEKYEKANPSLNMTPEAISAMSNLKAVTAQSAADYANGYLNYFKQNAESFTNGGKYQPAASFDQAWHSQPNVQTYLGAIDAMNGAPYSQWSKGLPLPVQQRALGVIARIDPTTVVNGMNGRIRVSGPAQGAQRQCERCAVAACCRQRAEWLSLSMAATQAALLRGAGCNRCLLTACPVLGTPMRRKHRSLPPPCIAFAGHTATCAHKRFSVLPCAG